MRRSFLIFLTLFALLHLSFADVTYPRVKLLDAEGHQSKAALIFSDTNKSLQVRPVAGNPVVIPYDQLDKFTYEYTRKHRITAGAIILFAVSVVGGIVVMCTKSTSHWLDVDYQGPHGPRSLVLRLDKSDYQEVIDSVKNHTGKDVQFLGCRMCKMNN